MYGRGQPMFLSPILRPILGWSGVRRAVAAGGMSLLLAALVAAGTPRVVAAPASPPSLRLLFVGASITAGDYANSPAQAYPGLVAARLKAEGYDVHLRVIAHPGATAEMAEQWNLKIPSDVLVVHLVTNDFARNTRLSTYRTAYSQVLRELRHSSARARLVCLGGWDNPRAVNRTGIPAGWYDQVAQAACSAAGGSYLDISGIYLQRSDHGPAGMVTTLGIRDGFHPNDRGHQRLAAAVLGALNVPRPVPSGGTGSRRE